MKKKKKKKNKNKKNKDVYFFLEHRNMRCNKNAKYMHDFQDLAADNDRHSDRCIGLWVLGNCMLAKYRKAVIVVVRRSE